MLQLANDCVTALITRWRREMNDYGAIQQRNFLSSTQENVIRGSECQKRTASPTVAEALMLSSHFNNVRNETRA